MNNSFKLLVISVLVLIGSCTKSTTKYDQINTFFSEEFNFDQLEKYNQIVVINELGHCMNCNNSFIEKVATLKADSTLLFLISTPGNKVDISFFMESQDNIIHDPYRKFETLNLVESCAIIELGKFQVDTIIGVNTDNLYQLELLSDVY